MASLLPNIISHLLGGCVALFHKPNIIAPQYHFFIMVIRPIDLKKRKQNQYIKRLTGLVDEFHRSVNAATQHHSLILSKAILKLNEEYLVEKYDTESLNKLYTEMKKEGRAKK